MATIAEKLEELHNKVEDLEATYNSTIAELDIDVLELKSKTAVINNAIKYVENIQYKEQMEIHRNNENQKENVARYAKWNETTTNWWVKWGLLYKLCLAILLIWVISSVYILAMYKTPSGNNNTDILCILQFGISAITLMFWMLYGLDKWIYTPHETDQKKNN